MQLRPEKPNIKMRNPLTISLSKALVKLMFGMTMLERT